LDCIKSPVIHLFFRALSRLINGHRPNEVGMTRHDPLELIKFWCWSGSGCDLGSVFHFP